METEFEAMKRKSDNGKYMVRLTIGYPENGQHKLKIKQLLENNNVRFFEESECFEVMSETIEDSTSIGVLVNELLEELK